MPQMLVLELINNPGDALTISLAGSPSGYRSWLSAIGSGVRDDYVMMGSDGQFEWGNGYPTAGTPNKWTRETVLGGSLGPGVRVPFVGQVEIYSDIVLRDGRLGAAAMPLEIATPQLAGSPARRDTLAWEMISRSVSSSPIGAVSLSIPVGYNRLRLVMHDVSPVSSAALYMRISKDGGATYMSDATSYGETRAEIRGGSSYEAYGTASYVTLFPPTANAVSGEINLPVTNGAFGRFDTVGFSAGPTLCRVTGGCNWDGVPTNILIGYVSVNVAGHNISLEGQR